MHSRRSVDVCGKEGRRSPGQPSVLRWSTRENKLLVLRGLGDVTHSTDKKTEAQRRGPAQVLSALPSSNQLVKGETDYGCTDKTHRRTDRLVMQVLVSQALW